MISITIGESLSEACKHEVDQLTHSEIENVHYLSVSASGTCGLYFVSHYPESLTTLTLQSTVTKEWHKLQDKIYKLKNVFPPSIEENKNERIFGDQGKNQKLLQAMISESIIRVEN